MPRFHKSAFIFLLFLVILLPACTVLGENPAATPEVTLPPDFSPSFTPVPPEDEPALGLEEQDPILIVEEIVIALLGVAAIVGIAARYLRVRTQSGWW
jgi:hypothetical protein